MSTPIQLVCSTCGSKNWYAAQKSMDERWMIARCPDHQDKRNPLTPLISERAFAKRQRRAPDKAPEDLFGTLNDDERAALTKAVKFTSINGGGNS